MRIKASNKCVALVRDSFRLVIKYIQAYEADNDTKQQDEQQIIRFFIKKGRFGAVEH